MKKGPKVAIIGAGSYFFGKPAVWNMVCNEHLKGGIIALVDTDPEKLAIMKKLAKRAIEATGSPTKVICSTDHKEILKDADFVVLTFSENNARLRGVDTQIAARYGITMCSSDTIGSGGIFRALREIPHVMAVCKDVENLCPDAWVINFINPSATIGIALMRYAPNIKSFALCDGNHLPYFRRLYMSITGILPEGANDIPKEIDEKFSIKIAGVNHCTWVLECTYDGKNILNNFRDYLVRKADEEWQEGETVKSKPRLNHAYAIELFDLYGAYPTAVSHTKEYVPFFQGYGVTPNFPEPLRPFDASIRFKEMERAWNITEKIAKGETPIEEFINLEQGDHATDIIESMWAGLNKSFFINGPNQGAVTNMSDDAFLELEREIDMNGFKAKPLGVMPLGLRALQTQVLDAHELTAEAAVTFDRDILLRAMCTDPIVNNISDAKNIINETLIAEKDFLPGGWYK